MKSITLINETKDQLYFYNIEELIEKKLEKNSIPEAVGSSPDYNPEKFLRKPKQGNFNKKQKSFHKKCKLNSKCHFLLNMILVLKFKVTYKEEFQPLFKAFVC